MVTLWNEKPADHERIRLPLVIHGVSGLDGPWSGRYLAATTQVMGYRWVLELVGPATAPLATDHQDPSGAWVKAVCNVFSLNVMNRGAITTYYTRTSVTR